MRNHAEKRQGMLPLLLALDSIADPGMELFAFERDRKRYSTLKNMLSKAHCSNVEAVNADFLTISPNDEKFRGVTHM